MAMVIKIKSDDARTVDLFDGTWYPVTALTPAEDSDDSDSQMSEVSMGQTTLMLPGGGPGDFDSDIGLSDVEPDNGHWCWAPLWDIDDEIYFEPALKRSKFG